MRTLAAALTTAQRAATREPYLRIHFDDRDVTTHTYTTRDATNLIEYVQQWEEPYAGAAIIRMNNSGAEFTAKDLRGYSVSIGWGMVLDDTPDSTWYSSAAVMKVRMQRDISVEGMLVTEFFCVPIWAEIVASFVLGAGKKLTGTMVTPSNFSLGETITGSVSNATGKLAVVGNGYIIVTRVSGTFQAAEDADGASASVDSIAAPTDNYGPLIYAAGDTAVSARIAALTGLTVTVDEDDPDGNLAATPAFALATGTNIRSVIRQMLLRTKCGMRYENDGNMHALYLDTTDLAQYEFDSSHAFFTDLRDRAIIIPNAVVFVDALPSTSGTAATYIGTANDATSVAAIGTFTTIQVDEGITSNAIAQKKAEAWIAQMVAEAYQGQITAPMECGLECYDMVQAVDGRLSVTAKGRIGRIEREFDPIRDIYEVRMTLGSLYSQPGAMDTGPDSRENDLIGLVSGLETTPPTVPPLDASGVLIDGGGITLSGSTGGLKLVGTPKAIEFWPGGTVGSGDAWYLYGTATGIRVESDLEVDGDMIFKSDGVDLLPNTTLQNDIGTSALKFGDGYINALYTANIGGWGTITLSRDIHPLAANSLDLGSASLYFAEVHAATGGFIEHSPRKFSQPSIELLKKLRKDIDGNIIVPKEFGDYDSGVSVGHLAYAACEAVRDLVERVERLERV